MLDFTVFLIHKLALAWKVSPSRFYTILNSSGILDNILFTRYSDGSEFTPKPKVSANTIFKTIQKNLVNISLDPQADLIEPVKPASLDIIL